MPNIGELFSRMLVFRDSLLKESYLWFSVQMEIYVTYCFLLENLVGPDEFACMTPSIITIWFEYLSPPFGLLPDKGRNQSIEYTSCEGLSVEHFAMLVLVAVVSCQQFSLSYSLNPF